MLSNNKNTKSWNIKQNYASLIKMSEVQIKKSDYGEPQFMRLLNKFKGLINMCYIHVIYSYIWISSWSFAVFHGYFFWFSYSLCSHFICICFVPLYIKHSLLGPFVVILLFNVVIFTLTLVILHLLFVLFVCFFSCHIFYNSCFYLWCQLVCLCSFQLHKHIQVACVHLGNCLHHSVKHFLIRPDIIIIYIFIVF